MQTNFSQEQLAQPHLAEAEKILRRCVHCGLCTAVCSTYVVLGDERDSPRGRIYLIKDMLENDRPASAEVQHHVDRCLSCLSCMTTCPGGVDYMHLVDIARVHIKETGSRSRTERFVRSLLAKVVPYPDRFRLALKAAPLGRPFVPLMRRLKLDAMAAMVELAPDKIPSAPRYEGPGIAETEMKRRARVIMLAGCAQQVLRPDINDATIRLLARRGVDVIVANGLDAVVLSFIIWGARRMHSIRRAATSMRGQRKWSVNPLTRSSSTLRVVGLPSRTTDICSSMTRRMRKRRSASRT